MTFIPKPHEIYKHFKGNLYQIVTIAQHSETGEQLVIYQAMYGDFKTYARPLAMFTSEVDKVKYPEVQQRFRFELQGADADRQIRETDEVNGGQTTTQAVPTATAQDAAIWTAQAAAVQDAATVAAQATAQPASVETQPEEPELDPLVLEFLDADTLEEKIHILTRYRNQMDEGLLNSIAISLDLVVEKKNLQEKYDEIMNCISMMKHFECNRLR